MPAVVVLLSCYQGAPYIGEQIESIRRQTYHDWALLVRDDGSSDDTSEIVRRMARDDARISLLTDGRGNLGPLGSFGVLLEHALERQAAYVALSDQDDVWRADKLERELELIRAHEASAGSGHPTLIHSDLAVVDRDLRPIHPSYLRYQRLQHVADEPLRRLLLQNFVTGCTVVLNHALLRVATPIPPVVMHDWWLAQCAGALGTILFLPEPTVLYRQHGANTLGSRGATQLYLDALRAPLRWWALGGRNLAASAAQVSELADRLRALPAGVEVAPEVLALVEHAAVALRGSLGPVRRCREVRRLGIRPPSLTLPFFFYLRMLAGLPDESGRRLPSGGRGAAALQRPSRPART
jgi:rhamnosyltransferase